jgi:hypothetical protein
MVPSDERSSENCLHCEINDLVQEHVEGQEKVDLTDLAARMAESVVDLILLAPEEEQAQLLAFTIAHLGPCSSKRLGRSKGGDYDVLTLNALVGLISHVATEVLGDLPILEAARCCTGGSSGRLAMTVGGLEK